MNDEPSQISDLRKAIGLEADRLEEDATYASKSHFNDAAAWDRLHLVLGVIATVLGAAAGATALFHGHPTVAAVISFLSAGTTAVLTFQKPGEHATAHRLAGAGYASVKQMARQLRLVGIAGPGADKELERKLSSIARTKARLQKESPIPSGRAFNEARAGIRAGEAVHKIDRRRR
jgi:hypothetical protein